MVTIKKNFIYKAKGEIDITAWLCKMQALYSIKEEKPFKTAALFTALATKGLTTFYGQYYIEQALEIAEILFKLNLDDDTIIASILIPAVVQTKIADETLKKTASEKVIKLIHQVLKTNILNETIDHAKDVIQLDRVRKTFLALIADVRVIFIILAEKTCIMRGIKKINPEKRKKFAQDALNIYAPLANRLGIFSLKWELEDLAFRYLSEEKYKTIASFLAERRSEREARIAKMIAFLTKKFADIDLTAIILGRAKHIYSIHLKAERKLLDYQKIYDCSAIRIIVPNIDDCYKALSLIHELYEYLPSEFDDYISHPKQNGYRSIHTAIMTPSQKYVEIQIRTEEMNEASEKGAAAHWLYKEKKPQSLNFQEQIALLRELMAWQKEMLASYHPQFSLDDIFKDRIYVFTPTGEIIDLPKGATPLDFAYHIHTALGHRTRGAKINGHIIPLTHTLKTGDKIDILTTQEGAPSRDWLNKEAGYLQSTRARNKVTAYFRQYDMLQYQLVGKQLLEKDLSRLKIHPPSYEKLAQLLHYKNEASLFTAYARGLIRLSQIIKLYDNSSIHPNTEEKIAPRIIAKENFSAKQFIISGVDNLLTRLAKCCHPIPFDPIIGYITQGRGVSIHRKNCKNIANGRKEEKRFLEVLWNHEYHGNYIVHYILYTSVKANLLKDITTIVNHAKAELVHFKAIPDKKNDMLCIHFSIQIDMISKLQLILQKITLLPFVVEIKRKNE